MNQFLNILAVFAFAMPVIAQRLLLIGVPHKMDAETGRTVFRATVSLVLGAAPKDRVQVFDATTLQRVTDITIPVLQNGGSDRARIQRVKREIGQLKQFLASTSSVREGGKDEILLPQFLELAGSSLAASSSDTILVIFGSPYYQNAEDPAFHFGEGYVPSDGFVTASSLRSVFGTADRRDVLKNATVHFCHLRDCFTTELERVHVRRFLKVWMDQLGATLATFAGSAEVTVERALRAKDPVTQEKIDPSATEMVMRKIVILPREQERGSVEVENVETRDAASPPARPATVPAAGAHAVVAAVTGAPQVEAALGQLPGARDGFSNIAVVWLAKGDASMADVDLYVRANPRATELGFSDRHSPEGEYLRDVRHADESLEKDGWTAAWEVVTLRQASINHPSVWLNLYRGSAGTIRGIVRFDNGSNAVDVPFAFPAIAGDSASGKGARQGNACWIEIPVAASLAGS